MITPNIWGHGQLFAFSALDGEAPMGDDFSGILCADKIGIRFFSRMRRELVITGKGRFLPSFETVTGDLITVNTKTGQVDILYAAAHLIIGSTTESTVVSVTVEGDCKFLSEDGIQLHDTGDGEITALLKKGTRFAFAYGHSCEEVKKLAAAGIDLPLDDIKSDRLKLYQQVSLGEEDPYARLYAKCLSVMKSQLYTPEGAIKRIWSTPDRLPHKRMWLWDSVFHAVGHRNWNPALAEDLILAVLDVQEDSGFIPHMAAPDMRSQIIQPPVIAWGAWQVYEKSRNKDFLRAVYMGNEKFLAWCKENRRKSEKELYTWQTEHDRNCRCGECGMDNSPRFDLDTQLEAIDFSCFMANDVRYMAKIAVELGDSVGGAAYSRWYEEIRTAINRRLWCEADGFYYDYDILNDRLHKTRSVASFLPLFAGICDEKQANALVACLSDPHDFATPFAVPSVSKGDPCYGTDMWRGAVWINYNYMIASGLAEYGHCGLAEKIRDRTVDRINEWYIRRGCIFEFYDAEDRLSPSEMNRKGPAHEPYDFTVRMQSIRDYGWTATLCFDWLHNRRGTL